jgi:hypothetical protein
MLVFSTQLCERLSNLLSGSTLSLLPCVNMYSVYTDTVCKGGGGVIRGFVGDHILQEFNTLYLTQIQNLQNCYTTPIKNLGGEGAPDR